MDELTWTQAGKEFYGRNLDNSGVIDRPTVEQAIAKLKWEVNEPGKKWIAMVGLAVDEILADMRFPVSKVPLIAHSSSDLAPFGLIGLHMQYKDTDARSYWLDYGSGVVCLAVEKLPSSSNKTLQDQSETAPALKPEVGMGGTLQVGSDRYAVTITDVQRKGQWVFFTKDKAIRTKATAGIREDQTYLYIADPDGRVRKATRRHDGRYREIGTNLPLFLGTKNAFSDPGF